MCKSAVGQVLLVNKTSQGDSKAQTLLRATDTVGLKFCSAPQAPGKSEEMQALGRTPRDH